MSVRTQASAIAHPLAVIGMRLGKCPRFWLASFSSANLFNSSSLESHGPVACRSGCSLLACNFDISEASVRSRLRRFCAARPFQDIPCPGTISVALASCSFPNEPATPYFWDESCELGALGCWADGLHKEFGCVWGVRLEVFSLWNFARQ